MTSKATKEQYALAQVMRADQEETHRAFWWGLMPREDKVRALSLARLDRNRAADELESFSVQERAIIYSAITSHIARMQILSNCCGITIVPNAERCAKAIAELHKTVIAQTVDAERGAVSPALH